VSIAHNRIKEDFKPINTSEKEILKKKCSECGRIKPITEFNLTITGKRHQDRCNDCEILSLQPKTIPKVVGQGKPLFSEGKAHQTGEPEENLSENPYKLNNGKCKTCNRETPPKLLHHGLCPICWTVKRELLQKERLSELLDKIKVFSGKIGGDSWFTAKSMAKYFKKTYEWAYSNLSLMEKYDMVESKKDGGKYWKVV
jgi:hypothetical protein